jgi:hypothetical protein
MKRRDLVRHLEQSGCYLDREGANHSIYRNPAAKLLLRGIDRLGLHDVQEVDDPKVVVDRLRFFDSRNAQEDCGTADIYKFWMTNIVACAIRECETERAEGL